VGWRVGGVDGGREGRGEPRGMGPGEAGKGGVGFGREGGDGGAEGLDVRRGGEGGEFGGDVGLSGRS
jgi:hypothetical protein